MTRHLRQRFWVELVLAVSTGALAVLTAAWPDWFEVVVGLDPDAGSGALEWLVVGVLLVTAVTASLMARREHLAEMARRLRPARGVIPAADGPHDAA